MTERGIGRLVLLTILVLGELVPLLPARHTDSTWINHLDQLMTRNQKNFELVRQLKELHEQHHTHGLDSGLREKEKLLTVIAELFSTELDKCVELLKDLTSIAHTTISPYHHNTPGPRTRTCPSYMWGCKSGQCIDRNNRCDGIKQCHDGSDEPPACSREKCGDNKFLCHNAVWKLCVDSYNRCDYIKTCPQGEDEDNCQFTCNADEFLCQSDFTCIHISWTCDGYSDCTDGADELVCSTTTTPPTTTTTQTTTTTPITTTSTIAPVTNPGGPFTCTNGQVISRELRCDGINDCTDQTDEINCTQADCPPNTVRCVSVHVCLDDDLICDGIQHCPDNSDETRDDCGPGGRFNTPPPVEETTPIFNTVPNPETTSTTSTTTITPIRQETTPTIPPISPILPQICPPRYVRCFGPGGCYHFSQHCDGIQHCPDNTDERFCITHPTIRLPTHKGHSHHRRFIKTKDHGISYTHDEQQSEYCSADLGLYKCPSDPDICIPDTKLCDTIQDCPDGTDELDCSISIDESDGTLVLVSVGNGIKAFFLQTNTTFNVISDTNTHVGGVAYDPVKEEVYWSESESGRVLVKPIRGASSPKLFWHQEWSHIDGIAVDWYGRNLYMADYLNNTIRVCGLVQRDIPCTQLINEYTHKPTTIRLDPRERLVYWLTSSEPSEIYCAGMDGSLLHKVIPGIKVFTASRPVAFTIDPTQRQLLWMDNTTHSVQYLSYDDDQLGVWTNLPESVMPSDLALDNVHIYWPDYLTRQIMMCGKDNCADPRPVLPFINTTGNSSITIYNPSTFLNVTSTCSLKACSHLCLLSPVEMFNYKCACPDHLILQDNGYTCGQGENADQTPQATFLDFGRTKHTERDPDPLAKHSFYFGFR